MKLSAISVIPLTFVFMSVLHRPSSCQQAYIGGENGAQCSSDSLGWNGYVCNGPQSQCLSFVTFRSVPRYDTPSSIADLLDSEPSSIASFNNFSSINSSIPSGYLVMVPVSCLCSGSIQQHNARYTLVSGDTYFSIAKDTYQGLTTCYKSIEVQNYYRPTNLLIGNNLVIPLRCACPSTNQVKSEVIILVTYMVTRGDTLEEIGARFGVSKETLMKANMLTNETIYASTPILVPLKNENCIESPGSFYCSCPVGYLRVGSLGNFQCTHAPGKKFPVRLVVSTGNCLSFTNDTPEHVLDL